MSDILGYILEQQSKPFVGIPLQMSRLNSIMQGIDKGDFWIITGQTSTFKSSFLMGEIILPSVRWILEHPTLDIKVFYFLLEENRQDLLTRITSYIFKSKFNESVTESQLHGRNGEKLNQYQLALLPEVDKLVDLVLTKIEIIDDILNPTGMYKHVRDYMDANGTTTAVTTSRRSQYVPNNPDQYVLFVVDHILDMLPEQGATQFKAIEDLVLKYCMRLKNHYRVIPILVQHQVNAGDVVQTDYKGKTIEAKLSPSLGELADNKGTARKALQVISLFNPASYSLDNYKGYSGVSSMQNNFLYLEVLKNRRGPKNVGGGIWVDPVSKIFTEFPKAGDVAAQMSFVHRMRNQQNNPDVKVLPRSLRGNAHPDQDQ